MKEYNNNNNNNNIYNIYNIYIEKINNFLKQKPNQTNFSCPTNLWEEFFIVIRKNTNLYGNKCHKKTRSEVLRGMIAQYCIKYNIDSPQTKINIFINKPEKVKINKSQVVVNQKRQMPDYSVYSNEDLVKAFLKADTVKRQFIAFEMKQRDMNIEDVYELERRNWKVKE